MKVLALETSTVLGGAAIIVDGQVVAEESSLRQRSHSESLHIFIENCLRRAGLALSDIDVFATGQGPGSFTGIRVAANTAKSYAYSFQKPMVTIDSLTVMASQVQRKDKPVLCIINAYKNMVYTGIFQPTELEAAPILPPTVFSVRDLASHIHEDMLVIGDGYLDYAPYFSQDLQKKLERPVDPMDFPQAKTLGLLAEARAKNDQTLDWNSFTPLYIRASEAEEKKQGIIIKPLS